MTHRIVGLAVVTLLGAALLTEPVAAQSATPPPVPPAECTVTPIDHAALARLAKDGIALQLAALGGDPTLALATPAGPTLTPPDLNAPGQPATGSTLKLIEDAARQYVACGNAGNIPALLAMTSEDTARRTLGVVGLASTNAIAGNPGTPSPAFTPTDTQIEQFISSLETAHARPADKQRALISVEDVTVLDQGWVRAKVTTAAPGGAPQTSLVIFAPADTGYQRVLDIPVTP